MRLTRRHQIPLMLMTLLVCLFAFALPTYADTHANDQVTLSPTVGCPGCHVDAVRAPTIASDPVRWTARPSLTISAVPDGDHALDNSSAALPRLDVATPEQRPPVAPDLAGRSKGIESEAMASDPRRWTHAVADDRRRRTFGLTANMAPNSMRDLLDGIPRSRRLVRHVN